MLTVNTFSDSRKHITGNRCEKGLGTIGNTENVPNMFEYKRKRIFGYPSLTEDEAQRIIGEKMNLRIDFLNEFAKKYGYLFLLHSTQGLGVLPER